MRRRSPFELAEELKEILSKYLETAYRISSGPVFADRADILREHSSVGQKPFVETTPRFEQGSWLKDINLELIPENLAEFASIGLPVGRHRLYKHQETALREALGTSPGELKDLIVATGTGSGKTEIFYLTILADLLREGGSWGKSEPGQGIGMGSWSGKSWQHRRQGEPRGAAIRAIILYPTNALVNDQLRRLRQILCSDRAIRFQREHLNGNLIYFGRYTSQTMLGGAPNEKRRRARWEEYIGSIRSGWENLDDDMRELGNWPKPDSPEMLSRWNMQAAPPDILLTNYSMLEYMLLRPIEDSIFAVTGDWLRQSETNTLTLVLDEAHTYSGARGTEVAYLIRRLYERLEVGINQVRCIATSASLGETPEELDRVRSFTSNLFDHPEDRFAVISASVATSEIDSPVANRLQLKAFQEFQDEMDRAESLEDEAYACGRLTSALGLTQEGSNHIDQLYNALHDFDLINALQAASARNAIEMGRLSEIIWGEIGSAAERERATAGLLAAAAIAREDGQRDSELPPLVPSRMHIMLRGLPGLWACIDPACTAVDSQIDSERPCGKLYSEPTIWCDCGARVVELLSCRVCRLLVGGGIEESSGNSHRIWPYEDDLEGGAGQYDRYTIFALEDPGYGLMGQQGWTELWRSTKTSGIESQGEQDSRIVWEPRRNGQDHRPPIRESCPRCGQRTTAAGRTAIEPLRTTGTQAFGAAIEHAFRMQKPRFQPDQRGENEGERSNDDWFQPQPTESSARPPSYNPNLGRKALIFSDSRQNAARIAGDLSYLHFRDLFRQLILYCSEQARSRSPIPATELVSEVLYEAIGRGIDPTFGELPNFWLQLDSNSADAMRQAGAFLDAYLRREIADRQVGVEALGLARWIVPQIDVDKLPALDPLDRIQTVALIQATLRILAGENLILPRSLDPDDWPDELVAFYYRKLITTPNNPQQGSFVWDPTRNNRLTRYLMAVLRAGSIDEAELGPLMESLWSDYYRHRIARPSAGNRPGFGIPISQYALSPIPETIYQCISCRYISADTVFGVCIRCHNQTITLPPGELGADLGGYYRLLSDYALDEEAPDPFPLRVQEHTAQISALKAATRERRFRDQFMPLTSDTPEHVLQHGIDIFSVTTTMEMGVDIGDLPVVGLHNMPPTVANYQQRAGRAGRRSDEVAVVLTFARNRSHDQYYFQETAEIVSGQVRIPVLHMDNRVISKRHISALILQCFFCVLAIRGSGSRVV